jgi:hypothetical protein
MLPVPATVVLMILAGQLLPTLAASQSQRKGLFTGTFMPDSAIVGIDAATLADKTRPVPKTNAQDARKELSERVAANRRSLTPRVVCGMVVIPADPAFDPGMQRVTPPPGVRYTIRATAPSVCR